MSPPYLKTPNAKPEIPNNPGVPEADDGLGLDSTIRPCNLPFQ